MELTEQMKEAAYKSAENNDIKGILDALLGAAKKDPRPVIERVKTFDDAVRELGDNHPLVNIYDTITNEYSEDEMKPVVDYIKVCIIVAALNEGWVPQFVDGEERWYPWFWLYTEKEMEKTDKGKRTNCRVVGRSSNNAGADGGVVFAHAICASSYSLSHNGSRLAFRTRELADYAGKQFIEEYYQLNVGL